MCQHIGDNTLVGLSPDSDETTVEITETGGGYVSVTTLVNTAVVGMRRPVRAYAVDQVLAVIGIDPRTLSWKFLPSLPTPSLHQVLLDCEAAP